MRLYFPDISIPKAETLFRKFQNLASININLSSVNKLKQKPYIHELQSSFPHHDLYHDHNSDRLPTMLCALASPCWHLEKKALMRNMLLMLLWDQWEHLQRCRYLVGEKQIVAKKDTVLPLVPAGKMVLDISMFPISTLVKASFKSRINRKKVCPLFKP